MNLNFLRLKSKCVIITSSFVRKEKAAEKVLKINDKGARVDKQEKRFNGVGSRVPSNLC